MEAKSHQKDRREKEASKQHGQNPWGKNGRPEVFEDLSQEECVERRLIIPDCGVESETLETKGRLREREPFIRTDLDRRAKGKQALKKKKCRQ